MRIFNTRNHCTTLPSFATQLFSCACRLQVQSMLKRKGPKEKAKHNIRVTYISNFMIRGLSSPYQKWQSNYSYECMSQLPLVIYESNTNWPSNECRPRHHPNHLGSAPSLTNWGQVGFGADAVNNPTRKHFQFPPVPQQPLDHLVYDKIPIDSLSSLPSWLIARTPIAIKSPWPMLKGKTCIRNTTPRSRARAQLPKPWLRMGSMRMMRLLWRE